MADQDIQLDLKKRARRRLVGAAALAIVAAVVLPMVMDKEPKPVGQDIQVRIPSQDVAPLQPPATSLPQEGVTPARPEASTVPPAPVVVPPQAQPGAPVAAKPAGSDHPATAPLQKPEPKPELKTEAKPDAKPENKRESKPEKPAPAPQDISAASQADAARAEAILSGHDVAPAGQYVVQIGVFSDAANVKKLRQRIKAAGYNSSAEIIKTPQGERTRVRAGPFASREAASKARDALRHAGLAGMVVAP